MLKQCQAILQNVKENRMNINEYFSKNGLWIRPMASGLIIATVPIVASVIDPAISSQVPKWITPIGLMFSGFGTGIAAYLTDTASAKIFRFFGFAIGAGALLSLVFK